MIVFGKTWRNNIEDCKLGGVLCVFGSHTFVPISSMCKKANRSFA